jgi:hypothetical protein
MWLRVLESPRKPRGRRGLATILSFVLLAAPVACARHTGATGAKLPVAVSPTPAPAPSVSGAGGQAGGSGMTAADQLATFFAGAQRVDGAIRHAADLVNGGFRTNSVTIEPATARAVDALNPFALAKLIPGGVDTDQRLRNAVMLVYSDLVSRQRSLSRVSRFSGQTLARSAPEVTEIMLCLKNGGPAAARFAGDLSAAKARAAAMAPFDEVAPNSHHAGTIAVLASFISLANGGCDSCGGYVMTKPLPVIWISPSKLGDFRVDGTVDGVAFRAEYQKTSGWKVTIMAC